MAIASWQPSSLVGWFKRPRQGWRNFVHSISLERLANTIEIFEAELDAHIEEAQESNRLKSNELKSNRLPVGWDLRSKQLLNGAKQAMNSGETERGWLCLKSADRFILYGLEAEELKNEARSILAESSDEQKGVPKWRRKSIQDLLALDDGKLKDTLKPREVFRAKRILDEHHDNRYHKLAIMKSRFQLLTVLSLIAIAVWLAFPPLAPAIVSVAASPAADAAGTTVVSSRQLWFAIALSGLLGALASGFSTSIATDQSKTRIPSELSTSTITLARLTLAIVSAIAVSIFLVSGVLNLAKPSFELLLAVAFASGFSDRLLLRAIDSLSK